jgi:6-phosphogluconolactonase
VTSAVRVFETPDRLFEAGASIFVETALDAVARANMFTVALAGGSTPARMYARLVEPDGPGVRAPWERTQFFWGDERHVPPDHPDSNYRMAHEALLRHLPIDGTQVHRVRGELPDTEAAAAAYDAELRTFFGVSPGAFPRLDLILLGLGADGHTASLFPGAAALAEKTRLAVATVAPPASRRVTLTLPVLNHAARVVFLVEGSAKADIVAAVLEGPRDPDRLPAQGVGPDAGELIWLLDARAASQLSHAVL